MLRAVGAEIVLVIVPAVVISVETADKGMSSGFDCFLEDLYDGGAVLIGGVNGSTDVGFSGFTIGICQTIQQGATVHHEIIMAETTIMNTFTVGAEPVDVENDIEPVFVDSLDQLAGFRVVVVPEATIDEDGPFDVERAGGLQ